MFSKAPIKRFNDEAGCAPPVTKYDPQFQTDLSASAKRHGVRFYQSDRFRESENRDGPFLMPDRPASASSGRYVNRPGPGQVYTQPRKKPSSSQLNKSISTQSLPVSFEERDKIVDFDSESVEDFKIHRIDPAELASQLSETNEKLSEKGRQLTETEAELNSSRIELESQKSKLQTTEIKLRDTEEKLEAVTASSAAWQDSTMVYSKNLEDLQKVLIDKDVLIQKLEIQVSGNEQNLTETMAELDRARLESTKSKSSLQALQTELGNKIEKLSAKLTAKKQKLTETEAELNTVRMESEEQKLGLQILERNLSEIKKKLREKDQKLEETETALANGRMELENEKSKLEASESKLRDTEEKLEAVTESAAALQNSVVVYMKNLEDLQKVLIDKDDLIQNLNIKVYDNEHLLAETETELTTARIELDNRMSKLQATEIKLRDTEEKLEAVTASSTALQNSVVTYMKELEDLQKVLIDKDGLIQNLELDITAKEHQVAETKTVLDRTRMESEEQKLSLQVLERNLSDTKEKLSDKGRQLTEAEAELTSARIELESEKSKLEASESKLRDTEEMFEALTAISEEWQSSTAVHMKKFEDLQKVLTDKESLIQNLELRVSGMQHQLAETETELTTTRTELENEKSKLHATEIKLRDTEEKLEAVTASSAALENSVVVYMKELEDLQKVLINKDDLIQNLNIKVYDNEHLLAETETELTTARIELDNRMSKLQATDIKLRDTEEKLEAVTASSTALQNSVVTYMKELEDLQKVLIAKDGLIQNLELDVSEKGRQLEETETALANGRMELENEKSKLEASESKLRDTEEKFEAVTESAAALQNSVVVYMKNLEDLQKVLIDKDDLIQNLNIKVYDNEHLLAETETELITARIELDNRMSKLQATEIKLRDTEEKLEAVTASSTALQNSVVTYMKELEDLQKVLIDKDGLIQNLELDVSEKGRQLAETAYELNVARTESQERRSSILVLERNLSDSKEKLEAVTARNLQFSLTTSSLSVELRDMKRKVEVLSNQLLWSAKQGAAANDKFESVRKQIKAHAEKSKMWQTKSKLMEEKNQELSELVNVERQKSREDLVSKDAQIENLKKQNSGLESLIGPFRQQLKNYETELKFENESAAENAKFTQELANKYANLLGHQNQKQKIHHLQKLKEEIAKLKQNLVDKDKELKQAKTVISDYERHTFGRRFDPTKAFRHEFGHDDSQNRPQNITDI